MDVNEWIDNESAERTFPRLNVGNCFTHSHPSKVEITLEIVA
jgi:hypothetical protein